MQEVDVAWDILDFAVFGAMLLAVGVIYRIVSSKSRSSAYRFGVSVALVAAFLLAWVNGAVGIIGNENNDANLVFFGVPVVGVVGALFARFRAKGMARALYVTAGAQVLVATIAIVGGFGSAGPAWPRDVLFLTGFFVALWLLSGWLFHKAARERRLF